MKTWLRSLFTLVLLLPAFYVMAQDSNPSPTLEITGANASDLPTITITTNILDSNNLPVENLMVEDFTLGGDLQGLATIVNVENISTDALPFATVLVIDTSTSMTGLPIQLAKEAATLFVRSVAADDPIAIVEFNNRARLVQDFTTDTELLLTVIENLQVGGSTALYDASVLGIEIASQAPVPRRAVILLSDGAEFGGASSALREDGLNSARQNGVSVYTIGLGFGTDRSYLQELSGGSNARNYESPTPDELGTIYAELAGLFRTQYVITLESDIPGDGTEYAFTLQSNTPSGPTNVDVGIIRAPIPVPIVNLDDNLFTVPFSSPVDIAPAILADDDIAEILVTVDDSSTISTADDGSFTLDPVNYPPGEYRLTVSATDVDGDTGSDSVTFETAAIGSDITVNLDTSTPLTEPVTVTLNTEGQTPAVSATYTITGESTSDIFADNTDAEAGFPLTINPADYPPGDYELGVGVENDGGATTNVSLPFSIGSIPPTTITVEGFDSTTPLAEPTTFTVSADLQAGTEIVETTALILGQEEALDELLINPADLQPGRQTLEITVTDSNGQSVTQTIPFTVASLPPQITFGELPDPITSNTALEIMVTSQSPLISVEYNFGDDVNITHPPNADGTYPPIPLNVLTLGEGDVTLVAIATNRSGEVTTEELTFTVQLPATETPTPDVAMTAAAQGTLDAQATSNAEAAIQATTDSQATQDSNATAVAQSTTDAQASETVFAVEASVLAATDDAINTQSAQTEVVAQANAQATSDAQSTADAQSTLDAEGSAQANIQLTTDAQSTVEAQSTSDAQSTLEAQSTNDAQATQDAQSTLDAQSTSDAQSTLDAQATNDAQATVDEATSVAAVVEATATITLSPTVTLTPEPTVAVTLTPVDIVEVDAQDADEPPTEGNFTGIMLCAGAILLGIILIAILFFGRRRDNTSA